MRKKLVATVCALALGLSLLAGCGKGSGTPEKEEPPADAAKEDGEAESESEKKEDASQGEIYNMVMEIITYGFDDPDLGMVEDAVNAITEEKIGVHVSFMTVPIADMGTKLNLLSAGGEKIDLVQAGLMSTPAELASQGLLLPLDDYLTAEMIALAGETLEACKVDGKIYAYPMAVEAGKSTAYIYDKDLAEQYQIDLPETISSEEDWEYIFSQVKASGMSQYAITLGDGSSSEGDYGEVFDSLGEGNFISYGCILDFENGTEIENWYGTDAYKKQCQLHREWMEKGYALPDSISNGYVVGTSMMQGTVFGICGEMGVGENIASYSSMTGKNLGYVPINDGVAKIEKSHVVNTSWGIAANSENPQKVADFLNLLYSDGELANLMTFGIEGQHYVTTEGSRVIEYPEGKDATNVGYGAFIGTYGDMSSLYFRSPVTDEFIENISEFGPQKALTSRFLGYSFDTSNVQAELASVTAVIQQYGPALICGTVDPDEVIPQFVSELERAGMDKIISENQAQLDAWLAGQ